MTCKLLVEFRHGEKLFLHQQECMQ